MSIWYYYNENGEKIQVSGGQLKGLAKAGMITPETIVETEEGKRARAGKVKGLTFIEAAQTEAAPPVEPIPTSAPQTPNGLQRKRGFWQYQWNFLPLQRGRNALYIV